MGISQAGPALASSANISHSYKTNSQIPSGSLVSLNASKTGYVDLADPTNAARLVGVAVESSDSLLAVDPSNLTTQVANSGEVNALVSTANGDIAVGDQIAISPFKGVGMRADEGVRIVGLAQNVFNSGSKGAAARDIKDKNGKTHKVYVGFVSLSIAIGTSSTSTNKLSGLQKLGQELAGHPVSTARIVLSALIAVIALASLITLVYGAIYGSIIAVGRNPLAKRAIFRTLTSVIAMAFATTAIALFTIFLLMR